jgi:hypothetical protein
MKADSITVQDFFHTERRHVVPLYQRPYVWKHDDQWEPLWDDLRQLAERTLDARATRPHFLGAIVLDQIKTAIKDIPVRLVIDGQQRLTTLQLMMGALREICAALSEHDLRRRLDRLTRNDDAGPASDQRFKMWPTNVDRPAFIELMDSSRERDAGERVEAARALSPGNGLLVEAYAYFRATFEAWLLDCGKDAAARRASTLIDVLRHGLNLVVIDLGDDDEAQVIFETLNARGTPLLPADLIKNHLFHAAEAERAPLDALYEKYWKRFDEGAGYWRKLVKQGRFYRPQIDLFLQHYLTLNTRDEVSATHLFSEFREFTAKKPERKAEEHLNEIQSHALTYQGLNEAPRETRRGLFSHRLAVMETSTLVPFLLGLFQRYGMRAHDADMDGILIDLESFLVRRMVCRLTTKDYNHLFLELLGILDRTEMVGATAAEVRRFLLAQTAESRLWPDDRAFDSAWRELPAYRALNRARLRMILEAIEARYRTELSEPIVLRGTLTVEHLLPQTWQATWPLPAGVDPKQATDRRETLLHRFGNLTLLTKKLNPLISNGDWATKHPKIMEHSALALNRRLRGEATWDEAAIERRTDELLAIARKEWPRREGEDDAEGHGRR